MDNRSLTTGGFTLPGEAGHEELTLELARRWGADVIRDSDGTQLSDAIVRSGYDIYSTLCLVRADNAWAKAHPDKLQQCCMMSEPVVAEGSSVTIDPLRGYFREQFRINADDDPRQWWQVFDRTTGRELSPERWSYDPGSRRVTVTGARRWHAYTVSFFSYRIWEEISMYNHVTNDWGQREHLMPLEPMHPEVQQHILEYLERWLSERPHTRVVRLTSLFYNFWWFWGDPAERRFIVNDWGSYEFTVSPPAIREFERRRGYRPRAEDFVNAGLYNNSYKVPSRFYRDWMDFINAFVIEFGRRCVERIHAHGKKAFVFYNDHWIGLEPWGERFREIGLDGIIDGIFSGFETRKVSGTPDVEVRELRLHPYLFPTGVNGAPSFLPGGDPTLECKTYWLDIRRALLREPVDRIGFGGYLHLVANHPQFIEYVERLGQEFRLLRSLHEEDRPYAADLKVALLTAWGRQRAWGCRGHYNRGNFYNEVMESVAGLPLEVRFLSFEDLLAGGVPADISVIVNAGAEGDAWSGGEHWADERVIEALFEYVHAGGAFIGVGEPSAYRRGSQCFQLAHLLGVDRELGLTRAFERLDFGLTAGHFVLDDVDGELDLGGEVGDIYLLDGVTKVLAARAKSPRLTVRDCGRGRSLYLAGYKHTPANVRLLQRAILHAARREALIDPYRCSNVRTECAYYPRHRTLLVVNLGDRPEETNVSLPGGQSLTARVDPFGLVVLGVRS